MHIFLNNGCVELIASSVNEMRSIPCSAGELQSPGSQTVSHCLCGFSPILEKSVSKLSAVKGPHPILRAAIYTDRLRSEKPQESTLTSAKSIVAQQGRRHQQLKNYTYTRNMSKT